MCDAVDYIADLRQAENKAEMPVGRNVVVIGGGMTAIDIAVQSKHLGAEHVDVIYRRGPEQMGASKYEQQFAQTSGVKIRHWATPKSVLLDDRVTGMEFADTTLDENGKLVETGETWSIAADIVFKAVGQKISDKLLGDSSESLDEKYGKLLVDDNRKTSLDDVWAGGDCVYGADDLTVSAVQDGKVAATDIDRWLRLGGSTDG